MFTEKNHFSHFFLEKDTENEEKLHGHRPALHMQSLKSWHCPFVQPENRVCKNRFCMGGFNWKKIDGH